MNQIYPFLSGAFAPQRKNSFFNRLQRHFFKRNAILLLIALSFFAGFSNVNKAHAVNRLHIAKQYVGLVEGTKKANKTVGVNTKKISWCGAFAALVQKKSGKPVPKGYLAARSWYNSGVQVKKANAKAGDILLIKTRYGNHVSIFSHKAKGRYCGIGGNQSNRVKLSCYKASSVRQIRR